MRQYSWPGRNVRATHPDMLGSNLNSDECARKTRVLFLKTVLGSLTFAKSIN